MEIRILLRQGLGVREVARRLGCSRNTVRRYMHEAGAPRYAPRPAVAGKLGPHKAWLAERVGAALPHRIPATVLLGELRARGYEGGVTQLRAHLAATRPQAEPEPLVRFETAPGQQVQVDWAVVRRRPVPLSAFVAVLGWSRAAYVEFVTDERLDTLIACHEAAFGWWGGTPREALYDNMRTVVAGRDAYGPGLHRFQPGFLDFARHHGFLPGLCRPYRARTKGKVERFVHYLRHSFLVPLQARLGGTRLDVATANAEVRRWLREVADLRVHGTTGLVPAASLAEEREALQPLADPWRGALLRPAVPSMAAIAGLPAVLQRPLSAYDELLAPPVAGGRA